MRRVPQPKWESESAMLAAFSEAMRAMGFRVVPEACGHDLILVAGEVLTPPRYGSIPSAIEPGDTFAVEGKLRGTIEVLRQALPPHRRVTGSIEKIRAADFYAVVIPDYDADFADIAVGLDVCVWTMRPARPDGERWNHRPAQLERFQVRHAARVVGHPPLEVPTLDVDMAAGVPAPRQLTPWKIAAVRLCLLGQQRDLSASDFASTPVRPRTFVDRGWMERVAGKGQNATWGLLDSATRPDRAYPEIAAAIEKQDPVVVEAGPLPPGSLWEAL